jgi:hypothetical protein
MIVAVPHLIVMRKRTALGLCPFGAAPSMRRVILNDSPHVSPDDGAETASARSEQFFGLDVDETHAQDIGAWALARHLACHGRIQAKNTPQTLECVASKPEELGLAWAGAQHLTLVLELNAQQLLRSARAVGSFASPNDAAQAVVRLELETARTLGGTAAAHPQIDAASWQGGLLSQVQISFARKELHVAITATQLANLISVQQTLRSKI